MASLTSVHGKILSITGLIPLLTGVKVVRQVIWHAGKRCHRATASPSSKPAADVASAAGVPAQAASAPQAAPPAAMPPCDTSR